MGRIATDGYSYVSEAETEGFGVGPIFPSMLTWAGSANDNSLPTAYHED